MSKELLLTAFFAVLTAVGGLLAIPTPWFVPFTMQTFVVLMSGLLLGPKYGPLSQLFYIAIGMAGLPVFAGGMGGPQIVFMPTFGFLAGFVLVSWVAGTLAGKANSLLQYGLVCLAAGASLYVVAVPGVYLNLKYVAGMDIGVERALQIALLPFIVPDLLKAGLAGCLAHRCVPMLRNAGFYPRRPQKTPA